MKNLKEKQLLVNLAKTLGQKADDEIINELREFDRIKTEARKSVSKDPMAYILEAAQKLKEEPKMDTPEYPLPPSLDELQEMLKDVPELKPEDRIEVLEGEEEWASRAIDESEESLIEKSVKFISEAPKESFQQPDPPKTSQDIQAIVNKLKYLEQWIGKISMAGPGSGETKFRFLDDIDRDSIGNTDQILRYRPASPTEYGKFFFGNLSGDQGPIRSMQYDTNGPGPNANITAGLVAWNAEEDCLNVYQNNTVLQVGLENYIRVHNHSGNTIPNGTFVQFAGVDLDVDAPLVVPYINNVDNEPLYSVGVLTQDLHEGETGKATTLGLVRNIDTTGNVVGETWQLGDILWANPSYPGKLTRFKPTSPNVSISVAAVLEVDDTEGQILVRPTIWPRFFSGDFLSTQTQIPSQANQAQVVTLNTTLFSSGVYRTGNVFTVAQSGLYRFDVRAQVTSTNSSQKSISMWFRKNGQNVPYSAVRKSSSENGGHLVVKFGQIISLTPTDNVSIHYAVTDTSIYLNSPVPLDGSPNIASVQVMVTQPSL